MMKNFNTIVVTALTLTMLGISTYWLANWWLHGRHTQSTNNAYIRSDITTVSSRIQGYVEETFVEDNQSVLTGDYLVRIESSAFQARLAQGHADLDKATATVKTVASRISLQDNLIKEAQAEIEGVIADHGLTVVELERAKGLVADNVASVQRRDIAIAEELRARAMVSGAWAHLAAVKQERDVLAMERQALNAEVQEKAAALDLLEIDLAYTEVRAPIDGVIGNRSVRLGQFVRPGSHLMSIVPLDTLWIVANFKETQLTSMRAGQPVEISVDTFPDVTLRGEVQSLSPASGAEFSLLPPENATGNFSKIVQRIPIKITLDEGHALHGRLRPGMSVVVDVDTRPSQTEAGILVSGKN